MQVHKNNYAYVIHTQCKRIANVFQMQSERNAMHKTMHIQNCMRCNAL